MVSLNVLLSRVVLVNGVVFSVSFETAVALTVELDVTNVVMFKTVVLVGVRVKFWLSACSLAKETARRQQASVAKM